MFKKTAHKMVDLHPKMKLVLVIKRKSPYNWVITVLNHKTREAPFNWKQIKVILDG